MFDVIAQLTAEQGLDSWPRHWNTTVNQKKFIMPML